ncbi:MAG: arginine--tRNA ligase [Candidatus Jorgensenbacteria bacterium]|nr:arginine--tRNA ligase [Candidatus Jorgensenbacteria bacterium]
MTLREKITAKIEGLIPKGTDVSLSVPENDTQGHYSTNVAFKLAKQKGVSPMEEAEKLASKLLESASPKTVAKRLFGQAELFERVEAVTPGFLNMWLSQNALASELQIILKEKKNYGIVKSKKKKKIQVEYISANPTGPLTLANGRGGFFGDALSNILEAAGNAVEREYYVNDTGNQILTFGKSIIASLGIIPTEEEFYKGEYVREWAKKNKSFVLKHKNNPMEIGKRAAKDFLRGTRNTIEKGAHIKFDRYTSEDRNIHKKGYVKKALAVFKKGGRVYEQDGAVWLRTKDFGDDKDRVLVKQGGEPTYFLADAGHYLETKERKFDAKINILGPDHYGYVARIQAVAKIFGLDSRVIVTQTIRLVSDGKETKMSKRKGKFITFEELISEVGRDAARFFFLMTTPESHMDFDLKLAKERSQKNPVFYIQYALVRALSILKKSKIKTSAKASLDALQTDVDTKLIRELARFPEVIADSAKDYKIHPITKYASELAKAFHNFYEKERVAGEAKNIAQARAVLVSASIIVFQNLFKILGISAPKKM